MQELSTLSYACHNEGVRFARLHAHFHIQQHAQKIPSSSSDLVSVGSGQEEILAKGALAFKGKGAML